MLRCEWCGVEDGEQLQSQPNAQVMKRACGEVLCDDHYHEHLTHDPSVGIFGCSVCASEMSRDWEGLKYNREGGR